MSNELFTRDANGRKTDAALHAEMLDDVEAEKRTQADAIQRAIDEDGMSPEAAERMFRYRPPSEYAETP